MNIMKYLLIILFSILTISAFAQHKCKPGYKCVPDMASTSHRIIGGCYPDSVVKKMSNAFNKSICMDTQVFMGSAAFEYSDEHIWNDSTGCTSKETWKTLRKGKWVDISKKEWDSLRRIANDRLLSAHKKARLRSGPAKNP